MKNNKRNRILSLLIVMMMILAMLPAGVFADDEPAEAASVEEVTEESPAEEIEEEDEVPEDEEPEDEVPEDEEPEDEVPEDEIPEDEVPEDEPSTTVVDDNDTTEVTVVEDNKTDEPAPAAAPVYYEDDTNAYDEAEGLYEGTANAGAIVYAEPDQEAEVVATLEDDVKVKILDDTDEDWYEVILKDEDSTEGYILKEDVTLDGEEEPATEEDETPAPEEEDETPAPEEDETPAPSAEENTPAPAGDEDEADEEDEELTEIDDYETPLGLAELIEVTDDADSEETAEEAEVTVTEDEATSEYDEYEEEAEVTVTEDEDTSEFAEAILPTDVKIGAAVRTEPDGMAPIILPVTEDTVLQITAQVNDDWYEVALAEETEGYTVGYVYKDDVILIAVVEPEKTGEPTEGEEEEVPKKVTIFTSRKVVMEEGETVYLTSKLEGFEGLELKYVWKVNKGEGFEVVEDANEATYSFEASAETLSWGWKLTVLYR